MIIVTIVGTVFIVRYFYSLKNSNSVDVDVMVETGNGDAVKVEKVQEELGKNKIL